MNTVARQARLVGQAPEGAQEQPQRLAVLVVDEGELQRRAVARAPAAAPGRRRARSTR